MRHCDSGRSTPSTSVMLLTRHLLRIALMLTISASGALLCVTLFEISMMSLNIEKDTAEEIDMDDSRPEVVKSMKSVEDEVPFQPFVANKAKSVIVLTYQRSGSSFFGQMFNSNPNAFYMFEPLDSLYSALYGTRPGWNIPSDITTFWNGTQRNLPQKEIKAVASFLGNIFSCDIDAWPTETVAHRYWTQFGSDHAASSDYVQCLRKRNYTHVPACYQFTMSYCGKRFGEQSPARLDECNRLLWSDKYRAAHRSNEVRRKFEDYRTCTTELRTQVEARCINLLTSACSKLSLRAVKTVRATMDSMEPLLQKFPNFRVIHLIRDPRAVALSRSEFDSSARGQFSNKAGPEIMTTEALLYCRTVARDILTRRRLSTRYPGRIYPLLYDDVVRDLSAYTRNVYRFMDEPLHPKTMKWIGSNARRKRNGTSIATRWQNVLTVSQNDIIMAKCSELFSLVKD